MGMSGHSPADRSLNTHCALRWELQGMTWLRLRFLDTSQTGGGRINWKTCPAEGAGCARTKLQTGGMSTLWLRCLARPRARACSTREECDGNGSLVVVVLIRAIETVP